MVDDITQSSFGELERERRKEQLRILAQLRNLAPSEIEIIMESVSNFFKEENDILYKVGEKRGKTVYIKNLLTQTDFSVEKIAELGDVPVSFVEKVKASLAKPSKQ